MDTKENPPLPGQKKKYGRYEVLRLIGEGAMGRVFLASDPVLKRQVAIKIVSLDNQIDEKIRREFLKRFSIEARLSAQLSHPSIVPVYDAGEENGVPWIAFQYVDGLTLDKVIKNNGKLSVSSAVSIASNIASALQQAHKINVVHRDIKPSNIIIDRQGRIAKLTDFGVAKSPLASLTIEGNAMGSPGYMSPEQIEGRELDHRSDLFSLGVVLYEMLTGRHPFKRDDMTSTAYATISGKYTPAKLIVKEIPARLEDIVSQCLVPDIDKRISDAGQLVELLGTVASRVRSGEDRRNFSITAVLMDWGGKAGDFARSALGGVMAGIRSAVPAKTDGETGNVVEKQQSGAAGLLGKWQSIIRVATGPFRKSSGGFRGLAGKNKPVARAAMTGILAVTGIFAVMLMFKGIAGTGKTALWFPEKGLNAGESALIAEFKNFYRDGDLDSAASRAGLLEVLENSAGTGHFLQGLVACRRQRFNDANTAFNAALGMREGKECMRRNSRYMAVRYALVNERVPDPLVTILARYFRAAEDRAVLRAVKNKPYWPRWNALRILQAGGKKVDLVPVFILDLENGKDWRVRTQAIRDLGDLGDRRAIPALKEARKLGRKDIYTSSAATRVLRKEFKVR